MSSTATGFSEDTIREYLQWLNLGHSKCSKTLVMFVVPIGKRYTFPLMDFESVLCAYESFRQQEKHSETVIPKEQMVPNTVHVPH